jgi:serine protease
MSHFSPRALVVLLAMVAFAALVPGASSAGSSVIAPQLLPDLDQEIASQLQVVASRTRPGSWVLGFQSAVRNIGNGPLIIQGRRNSASAATMAASQVVERSDGSKVVVPGIGSLRYAYSADHQHWHYLGFDRYELRRAGSSTVLVRDQKTGFCLGDRYPVTTRSVPNAVRAPVYVGRCGLGQPGMQQIEEGISVGYGDNYRAFLEYQDLPLDGLPDGRYVLVHRVNSDRRIRELDYANDASSLLLALRWSGGMPYLRLLHVCPDSGSCDLPPVRSAPQAHTSGAPFIPNDVADGRGWAAAQWNFDGAYGVDAPGAWANLIAAGAPGGAGVTVAVLDTGVAYADHAPFRRSPDLAATQFVPGWDFVDNDPYPLDHNGHGTDVASTIAEDTNNAFGLTGLAYGARIMPIRVLDRYGDGRAVTIAQGVRYAVDHGAKVINLSINFDPSVTAAQIEPLIRALEYATVRGALVVAASGNEGVASVDFPARSRYALSVGATTEFGCAAYYSNHGPDLDLVAPGGGGDAAIQDQNCEPGRSGRPIYQMTFAGALDRFGIATGYVGTSMAAPHVSAIAALVVASRVLGPHPTPAQIAARLRHTARDLGAPGYDTRYGWGLVSAAAATAPGVRGSDTRRTTTDRCAASTIELTRSIEKGPQC